MIGNEGMYWCKSCERKTYWSNDRCQRCRQVTRERERGFIIMLACAAALVVVIFKLWIARF